MKNTCLSMTRLLVLILAAVLVNAQVIEIKSNFDKDPLKDLHVVYGKKHKECPYTCKGYHANVQAFFNKDSCLSTFCYVLSVNQDTLNATGWDLLANLPSDSFVTGNASLSFSDVGVRAKMHVPIGSSSRKCFTVKGAWNTKSSQIHIHNRLFTCSLAIPVPHVSKECDSKCVLGTTVDQSSCSECNAVCHGISGEATGTKQCKANVLKQGSDCDPKVSVPCVKKCNVDCVMGPPVVGPCTADCLQPTATMKFYKPTLVPPQNNGKKCESEPITSVCSLSPQQQTEKCEDKCVVDGIPRDPCARKRRIDPLAKPFMAIDDFPITLRPPRHGKTCSRSTRTCFPTDCELGVRPTHVSPCDAICNAHDGEFAYGKQKQVFEVVKTAAKGGKCVSELVKPCSKMCPCVYQSGKTGVCAITSTATSTIPWVASGKAQVTYFGIDSGCLSSKIDSCSSVIPPIHCTRVRECGSCKCETPSIYDKDVESVVNCRYRTLQTAEFGGNECGDEVVTSTCTAKCRGCQTQDPICNCQYSTSNSVSVSTTVYNGLEVCQTPLAALGQSRDGISFPTANNLCPALPTETKSPCSTTVGPEDCLYEFDNLEYCKFTSTATGSLWVAHGTQAIVYTESRQNGFPVKCATPTSSIRSCSVTLAPTNCVAKRVCQDCSPKCGRRDKGPRIDSASCTFATITSAARGGLPCSEVPLEASKTCQTVCTPSPTDSSAGLFGPGKDFNAFFWEDASGHSASVGGRLAVCRDSRLFNYEVGLAISGESAVCNNDFPALFNGRDLYYSGTVYGARVIAGRQCSDFSARCGKQCNTKIDGFCRENRGVQCNLIKKRIGEVSEYLKDLEPTCDYHVEDKYATIRWRGASVEVIQPKLTSSGSLDIWNEYQGSHIKKNSTVVINVLGRVVSIDSFSLRYFEQIPNKIIWNFPDATDVKINNIFLYGTVLAPNATISGRATVVGQVFAKRMVMGQHGTSINILNVPYKGSNFRF